MSVQNLAAAGGQFEHLQLGAVCCHDDMAVILAQELHVQHLVVVPHKLPQAAQDGRDGAAFQSGNNTRTARAIQTHFVLVWPSASDVKGTF